MMLASGLAQVVISLLMLLSGAAIGGIFVRRGSFTSTFKLLQESVATFETMQRIDAARLAQIVAERDAAIARAEGAEKEADAERARTVPLERMLADSRLEVAELQRENARLRGHKP
ncbi:MAG TPA: hypothetical protein VKT52_12660 [Ktedonobacterales bacterium]|nr:hypothetical protein [Ktedonobacterales bacterium]